MNKVRFYIVLLTLIPSWILAENPSVGSTPVTLFLDSQSPQAMFASEEIQASLKKKGHSIEQLSLAQLGQVAEDARVILVARSNANAIR